MLSLKRGAKVVYPAHGIGVVEKVEKIANGNSKASFYTIRLNDSDMTIQVPTNSAIKIGIRSVIDRGEVGEIMTLLKKAKGKKETVLNWHKRQKSYLDRIKSGSAFELAEILRELTHIMQKKELSFGEQRMYENVRQLLVFEVAEAEGIEHADASVMLDQAFV